MYLCILNNDLCASSTGVSEPFFHRWQWTLWKNIMSKTALNNNHNQMFCPLQLTRKALQVTMSRCVRYTWDSSSYFCPKRKHLLSIFCSQGTWGQCSLQATYKTIPSRFLKPLMLLPTCIVSLIVLFKKLNSTMANSNYFLLGSPWFHSSKVMVDEKNI